MRTSLLTIPFLTLWVSCSSSDAIEGAGAPGAGGLSASASGAGGLSAGASGAGGVSAGASGGAGSGGAGSGGAGSGGAGSGGAGSGGAGSGGAGSGGTGSGGTGGRGGAGGDTDTSSPGCGSPTMLTSGRHTINVQGTDREYILDIPSNYVPSTPYKLIFGWHPAGGSAQGIADDKYYKQKDLANGSAIFVAPEGTDGPAGRGWYNGGDSDVAFTRAMVEHFKGNLCIDKGRIFSVGWSFGGMFSFTLGCGMADVFRAIAPMSGTFMTGCADGDHPVAAWISHGVYDDFVKYEPDGKLARDEILARNHCGQETVPTDPAPCVSYQGCDEGYPVTWCAFQGAHGTPDFFPMAVWNFFSQF